MDTLREALAGLPHVSLADVPTPLQSCPRLSQHLGHEVLVKRDDLTGLAFGGNKARHFEYLLGDALARGCDTVVVGQFAAQSNYCRQLAAACARLGLRARLVLRAVRPSDRELQGNLLLDVLLGADVTVDDVTPQEQVDLVAEVMAGERDAGHRVYDPEPSAYLSSVSYVAAGVELFDQLQERDTQPEAIYLAAAGETQAGLLVAAKFLGVGTRIVGVDPGVTWWDVRSRVLRLAHETIERLQLPMNVNDEDIVCLDGFAGPGYGLLDPASIDSVKLVGALEGLLLDPVYTAKAMTALVQRCSSGLEKGPLVFLHTGGLPALFSYREALGLPTRLVARYDRG